MTGATLAVALAVGAVVALVLLGLRSRALFEVRVGDDEVAVRGAVPGHTAAEVRDFVGSLGLPRGARIRGLPGDGRYRLAFSPRVPSHEHQRLRNFFYSRL